MEGSWDSARGQGQVHASPACGPRAGGEAAAPQHRFPGAHRISPPSLHSLPPPHCFARLGLLLPASLRHPGWPPHTRAAFSSRLGDFFHQRPLPSRHRAATRSCARPRSPRCFCVGPARRGRSLPFPLLQPAKARPLPSPFPSRLHFILSEASPLPFPLIVDMGERAAPYPPGCQVCALHLSTRQAFCPVSRARLRGCLPVNLGFFCWAQTHQVGHGFALMRLCGSWMGAGSRVGGELMSVCAFPP